jgi:hypothetical protein
VALLEGVLDGFGMGQQVNIDAGKSPDADVVAVFAIGLRLERNRVALQLPQTARQPVTPRAWGLNAWRGAFRRSSRRGCWHEIHSFLPFILYAIRL